MINGCTSHQCNTFGTKPESACAVRPDRSICLMKALVFQSNESESNRNARGSYMDALESSPIRYDRTRMHQNRIGGRANRMGKCQNHIGKQSGWN